MRATLTVSSIETSKPSNLILDARGKTWVTDFGLAKHEGADGITLSGDLVGTLRYMSPERFDGTLRHLERHLRHRRHALRTRRTRAGAFSERSRRAHSTHCRNRTPAAQPRRSKCSSRPRDDHLKGDASRRVAPLPKRGSARRRLARVRGRTTYFGEKTHEGRTTSSFGVAATALSLPCLRSFFRSSQQSQWSRPSLPSL